MTLEEYLESQIRVRTRENVEAAVEEAVKEATEKATRETEIKENEAAVLELLSELGSISEGVKEKILSQRDVAVLRKWLKLAAKAESLEQFENKMELV